MRKAKVSTNKGVIEKTFSPYHVSLFATEQSDISERIVMDKVRKSKLGDQHSTKLGYQHSIKLKTGLLALNKTVKLGNWHSIKPLKLVVSTH